MEPQRSVFVLDTDDNFRSSLGLCYKGAGFIVFDGKRSDQLFDTLENQPVDLIALGSLPGTERSLDVLRDLRQICKARVIMINDTSDPLERVISLELGADDCLSKPVIPREVLARSRSILRRSHPVSLNPRTKHPQYSFENWTLTPVNGKLKNIRGEYCELTKSEFGVLEILVKQSRIVLSREQILDTLNVDPELFCERSIDNHVAQLRKKVTCQSSVSLIKTVRRKGYMLNVPVEISQ